MATVKDKEDQAMELEVRESLAKLTKFFQQYEGRVGLLSDFLRDAKTLRHELITMLNARDNYDRQVKTAEINLERINREASTRLSKLEQGNRAIIERLTKKEIELDAIKAELAKKEVAISTARQEAELARDSYERKLAGLTSRK